MELIVISSLVAVADENIMINGLFQLGLNLFHIRKPENEIQAVVDLINGIEPRFYNRIVLHQFHQIAIGSGIKRLHYTECARMKSNANTWQKQLDDGYTLSTSVHDLTVLPDITCFDYVFYAPVFDSISKPGYHSRLPADFKLNRDTNKPKVIALGGVNACNLTKVGAMGFDGAAVLGTLWNEPDQALVRFKHLKEICLLK